jgi:hypothetical protein
MQTREQVLMKIVELERDGEAEGLYGQIAAEVRRLLDSGAIDLDDYNNDFRLPKLLYHTALLRVAESYIPLNNQDRATVKNLAHF